MKRKISRIPLWLFVASFCICSLLTGCANTSEKPIQWNDPVVETAFRNWLNKPSEDIFTNDLLEVSRVSFVGDTFYINETPDYYIRELPGGGRSYFPGGASRTEIGAKSSILTTLSDFAHCSNLTKLEFTSVSFAQLDGIEDLSNLSKLTSFLVAGNANLRNIDGLSKQYFTGI